MTDREQSWSSGFGLDDGGGHRMLSTLGEIERAVEGLVAAAQHGLSGSPRFGDNWVGEVVSAQLSKAATGDHGLVPVLREFNEVVETFGDALRQSVAAVTQVDETAADQARDLAGLADV